MGDDQRLEGRAAVRIPMQWSGQPGGGFTTAPESEAPRPPMRRGPFGYAAVSVEAQREDRGSLLNWMERAIRTRKEWPEFGWGEWQLLGTRSESVLAHIATWGDGSGLAVHNFADVPARVSVQVPREARRGRWRHIFGPMGGDEPEIDRGGRLRVELPPYGYHWFGRREGV